MLFTLLGLVALFLRDRNNVNNDHPDQDDNVDQGDDRPALENNDGQTSQEIPSDPVVLPTVEEPITGGDPHEEDQSLEEPMIGEPQVNEDCSERQSLEEPTVGDHQDDEDCSERQSLVEPTVGDPQINDDWSEEQLIQEPIIGEPEGDDVSGASQVDDDWNDYQSSDDPVSEASQIDDDLSEDIYYSLPEYSLSSQLSQPQDDTGEIIEINCYNYKIGYQLGEGGFGSVFEATRVEDNVQVAVKFASRQCAEYVCVDDFNPAPLEVALQLVADQEPRVPEIVQLLDWKDEDDRYIMVLERPMPSQCLDDFLRNNTGVIDEDLTRVIMRQAVFAAQTCCQRGVFHRDIKPENLLINPDTLQVKLIDFGCGAFLNSKGYTSFSGTKNYCPPEYKIDGRYYGEPATVWSLGVLLFEMLCWDFPKCADLDLIRDKLWTKDGFSPECCDFICSCLQINPEKRTELSNLLLHDWFKTDDVEDDESVLKINSYNYKMGDQLGEGGFGSVFEATRLKDNVQVAIKFVPRENAEYVSVDGYSRPIPLEVALHIRATESRIPEIIQLLDWKDEVESYIMVLELPKSCRSVDDFLRNYSGPMDEEDIARVIMHQAVLAAQACCQHGVFHRDIKMENLLINPDTLQVKLIDFGCGTYLNSEGYKYFEGTEEYCPLEYKIDGIYHGEPATVWSLGVLLFVMLCWDFPQSSDLDKIYKDNIVRKNGLSQECCDFIASCLRLDPKKRIELDDLLLHDWFKMDGVENDN